MTAPPVTSLPDTSPIDISPIEDRSDRPARPRVLIIVGLLTLALFGLTARRVFTAPLWGDEIRTWRDGIEKPLVDVLLWRHNADHAPLGHLLARAGATMFGIEHPWSMRLGAWLCALACVPAIWRLGRVLDSDAAGVVMALLLIGDPNIVFQATQARMYPPLLLATLLALTEAARLFRVPSAADLSGVPARHAIALCIALAVGLWSHSQTYALIISIAVVALFSIARHQPGRFARSRGFALAAIAVALTIGFPGVLKLLNRRGTDPIDDEEAARPFEQLEDATHVLTGANWITGVLLACAIAGFVVIARRRGRAVAWMLAGVMVMSIVDLLIAARYRPVGFARYLTVMQPSLFAGVAAFAVELTRWAGRGLSAGGVRAAIAAVALPVIALISFSISRTSELLPAHPLADPFRDALRSAMAEVAASPATHLLVLPRAPFLSYGRIYGLGVGEIQFDQTLFDSVAARVPRERGRREPPTAEQTVLAERADPITMVAIIPAREKNLRSADDPIAFARALAYARRVKLPDISIPDGTMRVISIRFTHDEVEVSDPQRPARPK